jgi:hypothetical protein
MIHSRQPGDLEKAVMQLPYVFSCHQGGIDSFDCPDTLVIEDFKSCIVELKSKGLAGIAILIDEADCLGKNVPLLQMFRNIFQVVEHCSLLLAGTEAVFPILSEVFSPIPRQFHRIDVRPFAGWPETMDLVLRPIPKEFHDTLAPSGRVVRELHELCSGAPDEVQLYCHHMYRSVEDGSAKRMALSPHVFREVLHEYRSNSSANVDSVLAAIERLPDKLLFESEWLSRRNLTLEDNIGICVLAEELGRDTALSDEEKSKIITELSDGYKLLFDAGIIEINNCIQLAGRPLSAGFWKSFVEVERGKRILRCRYLQKPDQELHEAEFQKWIESRRELLAGNEIVVTMQAFNKWALPSPEELHRLGRISGYKVPDVFGPLPVQRAVGKFAEGDVNGCIKIFEEMIADKEDATARNNLAFCQILRGDASGGLANLAIALKGDYLPLFELNKGVAEFLLGDASAARCSLQNALQKLRELDDEHNQASYVLLLEPNGKGALSVENLPIDVAILANLWRIGALTEDEFRAELKKLYSDKSEELFKKLPTLSKG